MVTIVISFKLLLMMCFGSLATDPSKLKVVQKPTDILISIGRYIEIACIWEKSVERYRVSWYRVNEGITTTVSSELVYVSNATHRDKDVLVIKSASVNDTGFYYCEIIIEIPFCKKLCGNGTTVIVQGKEAHSLKNRDLSIWSIIPLSVAVGILCLCYKKKLHSKLSGSARLSAPAGRPQETQVLEVAELCGRNESATEATEENSSCNSVEWAVSTLYESCDSFFAMNQEEKTDNPQGTLQQMSKSHQLGQLKKSQTTARQEFAIYFDIQDNVTNYG